MNIKQIKNTLREFQAENRQKFKNTQAELKKAVSYKKKSVLRLRRQWEMIEKVDLTSATKEWQEERARAKGQAHPD